MEINLDWKSVVDYLMGVETLLALNAEAVKSGKTEMTEEEIETEIAAARAEK